MAKYNNKQSQTKESAEAMLKPSTYKYIITMFLLCISSIGLSQYASPPLPLTPPLTITSDTLNTNQQVGYCVDHSAPGAVCTAGDFKITALETLNVDDGCSSVDDYMQIDLQVTFEKGSSERYEVGAWFYRGPAPGGDFNSQVALSGDFCTRVGLEAGLSLPGVPGLTEDVDGDGCVDADYIGAPTIGPGTLGDQTISNLILPCRDSFTIDALGNVSAGSDGITEISACTTYGNNIGQVCSDDKYRSFNFPHDPRAVDEIYPGTKSKCKCGEFSGGPIILGIPDISISKVCYEKGTDPNAIPLDQDVAPGGIFHCVITITNAPGAGPLDGAIEYGGSGFFYQDNYPQDKGTISMMTITPAQADLPAPAPANGNSVEDEFIHDASGAYTSDNSINIYPGRLDGGTSSVTEYDFTTISGDANQSTLAPINQIENTVCTYFFNSGDSIVNTYPDTDGVFCSTQLVTTPVSISSFKANTSKLSNGYDFSWTTSTETGNLGFNIYAIVGQTRFKLNDELIPSHEVDSMGMQEYSYQINSQFNGLAHKFILEDVDILGRHHSNGVYKLGKQHGVLNTDIHAMQKNTDWDSINIEFVKTIEAKNTKLSTVLNKQLRSNQKQNSNIKVLMEINKAGIYKVTYNDLKKLGVELTDISFNSIRVSSRDGIVAIDTYPSQNSKNFDLGSYFQFYAEDIESLYTDKNIYTLSFNRNDFSPVMENLPSKPHGNQFTYNYEKTVKINRNLRYSFASPIKAEPWFDTRMLAINSPLTSYFNIAAKNMVSADAELSFSYWGGLDFPDDKLDHSINFKINGKELGSDRFDGLNSRNKTYNISKALLRSSNEIEIVLPADNQKQIDLINMESISLTYTSRLQVDNDSISFSQNAKNLNVAGFVDSDVNVYAIQDDEIFKLLDSKIKPEINYTNHIQFSGLNGEATYIVTAKSVIPTPVMRLSDSKDVDLTATEHLIISHGNFIGWHLDNYAKTTREDYRIVDVQDIYSLYSGNLADGEAIKYFISDIAQNGDLKSVLLVGGDTLDYKNYTDSGSISFVPTIYRETDDIIKFSAVDALYGDVDNDSIPDIAIGRLPVRTLKELKTIIAKTYLYRSQSGNTTAILAADDSEALKAYQFSTSSNQILAQLDTQNWQVATAYLDEKSVIDARTDLITGMSDGARIAVYTGHSSSRHWSFDGLFRNTDVKTLTNFDSPLGIIQWGCWNTYFVDPKEDSLGHEFMLAGKQGAAFVVGASTLTDANLESKFSNVFHQIMLEDGETIGSAMIKTKQGFATNNRGAQHKDILWGITILGDPLIKIN